MSEKDPFDHLRVFALLVAGLLVAAMLSAGYSFYSGHQAACARSNKTLDVIQEILVSTEPPAAKQTALAKAFYTGAFDRIAQARC